MAEAQHRCKATLPVQRGAETVHVRCALAEGDHVRHNGFYRCHNGRIVDARWGGGNRAIVSPGWTLVEVTGG